MKTRNDSIEAALSTRFDLVIVGGGIAGAGIAQNAASRGLSVCLLEKDDFASGTSSKTTKLIHGGLRYLEQLRVKLTAQLCKERALLERLAPHMVRDFSFILPLTKQHAFLNFKAGLGLTLYDLVAWSALTKHNHRRIGKKETFAKAPALDRNLVDGGLEFHDCITDDARIVLSVIKSACDAGAVALNYCQTSGIDYDRGSGVYTIGVRDRYNGRDISICARAIVNATGVWSDEVCKLVDGKWRDRITPSKGTHIIVPPSVFETNTALFLPTGDDRYVFVVPWHRALMIGTTDERYTGDIDSPVPTTEEIDYLLRVVNSYTTTQKLQRSQVIASFAGLRPLVRFDDENSNDTSSMSREHLIWEMENGMVAVAGGKLTSYRLMAEEVIQKVLPRLGRSVAPSKTETMMLGGWESKDDYLTRSAAISMSARKQSLDPATIEHLLSNYGADAQLVVDIVERNSAYAERICPDFPAIMAEVPFCVTFESAVSLQDLLFRRLRLGVLHHRQCLDAAPKVGELMKALLSWDDRRYDAELSAVRSLIGEHMAALEQPVAAR